MYERLETSNQDAGSYDPLASVQAAGPPGVISFVIGLPDPATFPAENLREMAHEVLTQRPSLALQYGPEQGYGPLIDYVRQKLKRDEGLTVGREQVMTTAGCSPAIDLMCTLFTQPGDVVLVEAPTYHGTLGLFRDHGLRPVQVTTDAYGLVVEALEQCLRDLAAAGSRPRLLYTIPNFQNPTGITMAAERRQAVAKLAAEYDALILEDDVYRDLAYEGETPPALYALDGCGHVVRIGSFSKILAPGLRLGWAIAPPALIQRVVHSGLLDMGGGANPFVANVVAAYCAHGLLEPHIARVREVYRERRDIMLDALARYMPAEAAWRKTAGGFFIWLTLPPGLRTRQAVEQAARHGVAVLAGDPCFAERATGQHLRLAFSYVPLEKIEQGIKVLGNVLRA